MIAYLLRRLLLAVPTLIGVNLLLFTLFFVISSPDDMARAQLGAKRVTPEAIERWKADRGYDKPLFWNAQAEGSERLTETIFVQKSARMFLFDFGMSDAGRDINRELSTRMWPSLALALPVFLAGLLVAITLALLLAFLRATWLDFAGVVFCVVLLVAAAAGPIARTAASRAVRNGMRKARIPLWSATAELGGRYPIGP